MKHVVYFTQGSKGILAKTAYGKIVFPHKTSNLKLGFAEVDLELANDKGNYAFVEGQNLHSKEASKEELFALFAEKLPKDIFSIKKGITKEGILVYVVYTRFSEYLAFYSDEKNQWLFLVKNQLTPGLRPHEVDFSTLLTDFEDVLTEEEVFDLQKEFCGHNWISFSVEEESWRLLDFPEWVKKGLKKGYLQFLHLLLLKGQYLEHMPLVLEEDKYTYDLLATEEKVNLLKQIREYNKNCFIWWKEEGLKHLSEDIQKYIMEAFKTSPLFKEVF